MINRLAVRYADMRNRRGKRVYLEGKIRRTADSDLWYAVKIAAELTDNPSLKDALLRASGKLRQVGGEGAER